MIGKAAILTARTLKADGLDVPDELELPMLELVSKSFADGQTAAREKWTPIYKALNGSDPAGSAGSLTTADKTAAETEIAKQKEAIKTETVSQHIKFAKSFLTQKSTENQNPLVKRAQTNAEELLKRYLNGLKKTTTAEDTTTEKATLAEVTEAIGILIEVRHIAADNTALKAYQASLKPHSDNPTDETALKPFDTAANALITNTALPKVAETAPTEAPTENIEELLAKLQPEERESVAHELAEYEKGYLAGIEQARTGKGEMGDEGDEEKTLAELGEQIGYLNSYLAQILFRVKDIPTETPNTASEEQKTTYAKYREKAVKIVRELAKETKVAILPTLSRTVPEVAEEKPEDAGKNLGQKWKNITFEQLKSGASFLPKMDIEYLKTGKDNTHLYKIYTDAYAKLDSEAREDANISWQMGLAANAKFKREVQRTKADSGLAKEFEKMYDEAEKDREKLLSNLKNPFSVAVDALLKDPDVANESKIEGLTQFKTLKKNFFSDKLTPANKTTPAKEDAATKKEDAKKMASIDFVAPKAAILDTSSKSLRLNFDSSPAITNVPFKIIMKGGKPISVELNADYTDSKFGGAITLLSSDPKKTSNISAMGMRMPLGGGDKTQFIRPTMNMPFLDTLLASKNIKPEIITKLTALTSGNNPLSFTEFEKQSEEMRNRVIDFLNKVDADLKGAISTIDPEEARKMGEAVVTENVATTTPQTSTPQTTTPQENASSSAREGQDV